MDKKINITILGGGNVAIHLAREIRKHSSLNLLQIYNRSIDKIVEFQEHTQIISNIDLLKKADVFIIAISDDAISDFSKKLSKFSNLIVHTSGSVHINDLHVKNKGVFYMFQTFSEEKKEMNFRNIPILIETERKEDKELLFVLANILSDTVKYINSEERMALHIGGVFVSNFVNYLYVEADKILKNNNLSFDLLKPLILEVSQKVMKITPVSAQTGPAIRGDERVIQKHLKFIKDKNQIKIYKLLTKLIQNSV